jgi:hypothetical protein
MIETIHFSHLKIKSGDYSDELVTSESTNNKLKYKN